MKLFAIVVCLAVAIFELATAQTGNLRCMNTCSATGTGTFAGAAGCGNYYKCVNGTITLLNCPSDQYYNPQTGGCCTPTGVPAANSGPPQCPYESCT